jgi:hypothetical protein
MSNKLVKAEDNFYEEDELNIYDILNIFLKNIKTFIIVTIIGLIATCLFIAKKMIFDKNNTTYINYTLNYEEIKSYIGKDIYYPQKSPKEILLDDKYLALLFENPELKSLYEEKVKENKDDISTKRDFLTENKILETSSLQEMAKTKEEQDLLSPDSYRTTVRVNKKYDKNRAVSDSIMKSYLSILNQYYKENMFDYLEERKAYLEKSLPVLKRQLEENAVDGKISISSGGSGTNDNNYFKYIYPIQVSNIDTYYEKYKTFESEYQSIKTLIDLELNKAENFIKYDSSIINVKEKSGVAVKLAVGLVISMFLGILVAFVKEFIEGYKKNKANN